MPRRHDARKPAEPRTEPQRERTRRILRAAATLGAQHGLEQLQMSDVAARADVALGTLYRYYPSKHHLFASLLADRVERLDTSGVPGADPVAAVAAMMVGAVRAMLTSLPLARAMIVSVNVVRTEYELFQPIPLDELILRTAGLTEITDDDRRLARLVEQCCYGILTWAAAGMVSPQAAAADVDRACRLLLAPYQGRGRCE